MHFGPKPFARLPVRSRKVISTVLDRSVTADLSVDLLLVEFSDGLCHLRVIFPGGTVVDAVALSERREDDPGRDFGLYLDRRWMPTWDSVIVDWPDFGTPIQPEVARRRIRSAFRRAKLGQVVQVGCLGGLGRTGTVLGCMAALAGVDPANAVGWVRAHYDKNAIETPDQEQFVTDFVRVESLAWCVFRNLVHTVYREARHIGPAGDTRAKLTVDAGKFVVAAERCASVRQRLKRRALFDELSDRDTTGDVLGGYEELTTVSVEDLVIVFDSPGWMRQYGGPRWAKIARLLIELRQAIDAGDMAAMQSVCAQTRVVEHNSGLLVPSPDLWEQEKYQREKWPKLCWDEA